ncbi:hypothetical protein [Streptococcus phocae]|uniref:Uncharacterized protein n=1 Tax=Streptococcus phocae TaxID=119224 RepID=A0A0P6SQD0_9STRE|nr:hypothetical protein [Streptococcus phocae]KPJ21868.1 hypothetical protein AKK44_07560 [Streptococcus phocae]
MTNDLDILRQTVLNGLAKFDLYIKREQFFIASTSCTVTFFESLEEPQVSSNQETIFPIRHLTTKDVVILSDADLLGLSLDFTRESLVKATGEVVCLLNGIGYIDYVQGGSLKDHEEIFFSQNLLGVLRGYKP